MEITFGVQERRGTILIILKLIKMPEGHKPAKTYFSSSKKQHVEIATMNSRHLMFAYNKTKERLSQKFSEERMREVEREFDGLYNEFIKRDLTIPE